MPRSVPIVINTLNLRESQELFAAAAQVIRTLDEGGLIGAHDEAACRLKQAIKAVEEKAGV